jgi:hypothetical protein
MMGELGEFSASTPFPATIAGYFFAPVGVNQGWSAPAPGALSVSGI